MNYNLLMSILVHSNNTTILLSTQEWRRWIAHRSRFIEIIFKLQINVEQATTGCSLGIKWSPFGSNILPINYLQSVRGDQAIASNILSISLAYPWRE